MSENIDFSQWQWQQTENGKYLTCQLLADWQHGFFSNHFQGKPPEILVKYLHPHASSYRLKQIHSDIVHSTDVIDHNSSNDHNSNLLEGDGIITKKPLQSVWSASADCTPILIADHQTGNVAAIHSGWRGTSKNIISKAMDLFLSQGSKLEHLLFALGPAIHGRVYQVHEEVAIKVLNTIIYNSDNLETKEILDLGYKLPNKILLPDDEENKIKLNVTQVINLQIQQQGISRQNIAIAPYCTYETPEYFFSYRRSLEKNVQWSGIISLE